jgi:hypothetical protein
VTRFVLEASGVVLNAASPQGWTFSHVNYSNRAMAGWTASAMPDPLPNVPDDVRIESPFTIKPNQTLSGFSFQSPQGPKSVTYYVQGFTQWITGNPLGFSDAQMDTFNLENNSKSGTVSGPVAPCKNGGPDCSDNVDNDATCNGAEIP